MTNDGIALTLTIYKLIEIHYSSFETRYSPIVYYWLPGSALQLPHKYDATGPY